MKFLFNDVKKNYDYMSQFLISCQESRIENNKSFYGRFYLGPFDSSQSVTIANALRRTLLSELYGLAIVSVEIEGANHEYSSLPGVKDSVLDILLNLKEIVLKKTIKNFKPQIGYLRVRGPGIVRAGHLRFPPFIQSVDPDQYIATLADNGFLNMKFIIQYGNKWLSHNASVGLSNISEQDIIDKDKEKTHPQSQHMSSGSLVNTFNLQLKKRRLFFEKLKQIGIFSSNLYINLLSKKAEESLLWSTGLPSSYQTPYALKGHKGGKMGLAKNKKRILAPPVGPKSVGLIGNKKYSAINLKIKPYLKNLSKSIFLNLAKPDSPDSPDSPLKGGLKEGIKEGDKFNNKLTTGAIFKYGGLLRPKFNSNISKLLKKRDGRTAMRGVKNNLFSNSNPLMIDAVFNPINKVNYTIEINDLKTTDLKMNLSHNISSFYDFLKNNYGDEKCENIFGLKSDTIFPVPIGATSDFPTTVGGHTKVENIAPPLGLGGSRGQDGGKMGFPAKIKSEIAVQPNDFFDLRNILSIKDEIDSLTKNTVKHHITLEIWTNGSIHPRDALYQSFKNLISVFSKLKKINTIREENWNLTGLPFSPIGLSFPVTAESKNVLVDIFKNTAIDKEPFLPNANAPLLKKIKMGQINTTFIKQLLPLNNTSFLSTYIKPTLRNYYLNISTQDLSKNFKKSIHSPYPTEGAPDGHMIDNTAPIEYGDVASKIKLIENSVRASQKDIYKTDIGSLNLSLRSYTCLKRLDLNLIGDLVDLSKNNTTIFTFLTKKLGKDLIKEIQMNLEKRGLNL